MNAQRRVSSVPTTLPPDKRKSELRNLHGSPRPGARTEFANLHRSHRPNARNDGKPLSPCRHIGGARTRFSHRVRGCRNLHRSTTSKSTSASISSHSLRSSARIRRSRRTSSRCHSSASFPPQYRRINRATSRQTVARDTPRRLVVRVW